MQQIRENMTFVNNSAKNELQDVQRRIQDILLTIQTEGLPNELVVEELRRIYLDFEKIDMPENI